MKRTYHPIAGYGIIGNTRTAALVNREASIDWLCAPNFDNDPILFPLLDLSRGGCCAFVMDALAPLSRHYIGDTAVLESKLRCIGGELSVTDFMPVLEDGFSGSHTGLTEICRIVRCLKGAVDVDLCMQPSFSFRRKTTHQHASRRGGFRFISKGRDFAVEAENATFRWSRGTLHVRRKLSAGDSMPILLTFSQPAGLTRHGLEDVRWLQQQTIAYWTQWATKLRYEGNYRNAVVRSAVTLKLLSFSATGAIVAAPTTSLPERVGSCYNWDYRFTWLRDATFTLVSLLSLECVDEAFQFFKFLNATIQDLGGFHTLFTIFGTKPKPEIDLHRLHGYEGSRPVRVGNAAAGQLQLDIFGELVHCIYLLVSHSKLDETRFSFERDLWGMLQDALDAVCEKWRLPEAGIWETRDTPRHFVYSQGMCWLALERGIEIAEKHKKTVPASWRRQLALIKREFHRKAYGRTKQSYVQAYGEEDLDASVLRLAMLGLLDCKGHRMQCTLEAIERELTQDGFILRNKNLDAGAVGEGAFLPCSFWYCNDLALSGRVDDARQFFERLLSCCNDLGLLAEEIDPPSGVQLGNFPQAFSHVGLINAAVQLSISAGGHYSESHAIISGKKARK